MQPVRTEEAQQASFLASCSPWRCDLKTNSELAAKYLRRSTQNCFAQETQKKDKEGREEKEMDAERGRNTSRNKWWWIRRSKRTRIRIGRSSKWRWNRNGQRGKRKRRLGQEWKEKEGRRRWARRERRDRSKVNGKGGREWLYGKRAEP